jgi:hypothetical protein
MGFRTLLTTGGERVNVIDPLSDSVDQSRLKGNADAATGVALLAVSRVNQLTADIEAWRVMNTWRRASLRMIIDKWEVEHAEKVAHQKTAERLFNESVEAPRPEERPFANTLGLVQKFKQSAFEEEFAQKPIAAEAKVLQGQAAEKVGYKIPLK